MIPALHKIRSLYLNGVFAALVLLNALDGVLTINWVGNGIATELNPLMDLLISTHPLLFLTIKLLLVSLGTYLLWRHRTHTLAVACLYIGVLTYSLIMLQHLNTGLLR